MKLEQQLKRNAMKPAEKIEKAEQTNGFPEHK
jgi:hypothetical protein